MLVDVRRSRLGAVTTDAGWFWTENYPSDITLGQSIKCGLAPWTEECKRLREHAALIEMPVRPVPGPPGVLAPSVDPAGRVTGGSGARAEYGEDPSVTRARIAGEQMRNWQGQLLRYFSSDPIPLENEQEPGAFTNLAVAAAAGLALWFLVR